MNAIAGSPSVPWTRDCIAAGRLMWARWGGTLVTLWTISAAGLLVTATIVSGQPLEQLGQRFREGLLGTLLTLTQLPLLLYAIFAIDWSTFSGGDQRASQFDPFLLRSPISSSRLVMVAVVARMTAIAVSLIMISMGVYLVARSPNDIDWGIFPALLISLSTTSISVLAFCWRPFSWNGFRVLTLLVLIPVGYLVMVLPFAVADSNFPSWLAIGWLPWPVAILWLGVVWVTYRSLELARCHSFGLESTSRTWWGRVRLLVTNCVSRVPIPRGELTSQRTIGVLAWFDAWQTRATRWALIGWVGIPTLVLLVLLPLSGASVVIAGLMVLTYVGMATSGGWSELHGMNRGSQGRALPLILAVSPVSRESLAWVKIGRSLCLTLSASGVVLGAMAIVSLLLQRDVWVRWSQAMLTAGETMSSTQMGIRVALVIGLALMLVLVGRGLAMLWLALMADRRVTSIVILAMTVFMFYHSARVGTWYFALMEWDQLMQAIRSFPARIPGAMSILLWLKLAAVMVGLAIAAMQPGRPFAWIAKTTLGWAIAVVTISLMLVWLLPDQIRINQTLGVWRPEAMHVWMAVALALPLLRLLILPFAIGRDIHR